MKTVALVVLFGLIGSPPSEKTRWPRDAAAALSQSSSCDVAARPFYESRLRASKRRCT